MKIVTNNAGIQISIVTIKKNCKGNSPCKRDKLIITEPVLIDGL